MSERLLNDEQGLWYEISLSNKQVIAAFLILLGCIVGAFLSGVWVGRETGPAEGPLLVSAGDLPESGDGFPFFGDEAQEPKTTVEAAASSQASDPPADSSATPASEPVVRRPEPARDLPAAPQLSADDLIIQVFSSAEESQARSVLRRLVDSNFDAFLSPVAVDGRTMYRVRVGPFENRRQAERVANRVKREQRLDTWITAASN